MIFFDIEKTNRKEEFRYPNPSHVCIDFYFLNFLLSPNAVPPATVLPAKVTRQSYINPLSLLAKIELICLKIRKF